jgi:hypothetical protein
LPRLFDLPHQRSPCFGSLGVSFFHSFFGSVVGSFLGRGSPFRMVINQIPIEISLLSHFEFPFLIVAAVSRASIFVRVKTPIAFSTCPPRHKCRPCIIRMALGLLPFFAHLPHSQDRLFFGLLILLNDPPN